MLKRVYGQDQITSKMVRQFFFHFLKTLAFSIQRHILVTFRKWKTLVIITIASPAYGFCVKLGTAGRVHRIVSAVTQAFNEKKYRSTVFLDIA